MEETLRLQLLDLIAAYTEATGATSASVGKQAINDNTVFGRLADRSGTFTVRTYDRLVTWISDRWPAERPWPSSIPRPALSKEQVAA